MAGPVPLGTQVTELINAAKVCKSIFDAFFHQYDNAPARLYELRQLVNTYEEILKQNQETLKRRDTPFPGHDGLKRTLEECTDFLKKYKSVCDRKSHGASKIVFTAIYALDQNHVARLDRQLMRHALPMLLWNSNSLLKWAFDRGEEPPVIQQPDLRLAEPVQEEQYLDDTDIREAEAARQELERFRREMVELQCKMPRPLQRHVHRAVFFREYHDIVSRHWLNLGLPEEELIEIFSGTDTPEDPLPQGAPAVFASESALRLTDIKRCKVSVSLDSHGEMDFGGYRVEEDQMRRLRALIWYDEEDNAIMKHQVPFQTHPHTYHSIHTQELHKVYFLQKHNVVVGNGHQNLEPIYTFDTGPECKAFQRYVRNRELLGTFDANVIRCAGEKLAELQQIKIWRLDGADDKPTLSFFADRLDYYEGDVTSTPATFCEMHLRWFEAIPRHETPRVLRLVLNKQPEELETQSPRRRLSLIKRRRSSTKASPTSPLSSISVEYADLLYDTINQSLTTWEEPYAEMEYLDIEFSHARDVLRFLRTSRNAHPRSVLGSQLSVSMNDGAAQKDFTPLPGQAIHGKSPSGHVEPEATQFRSRSASSNPPIFPIDGIHPASAPSASGSGSIHSRRSDPRSMPPTPALTEQSIATPASGASALNLQTPPSLPSLQMPPSFYSIDWDYKKDP